MKVLIDPGHGGDERGATYEGVAEAPINLSVAGQLYDLLRSTAGYDVARVRSQDITYEWRYRRSVERRYSPDVVLSIHCDSSNYAQDHGIRTYCWPGNNYSHGIATMIERAAPASLRPLYVPPWPKIVNKKEWPSAYGLIAQYRAPVVLVEMGFISNEKDRALLQDKDTQRSLVAAMFCGLAWGFIPRDEAKP